MSNPDRKERLKNLFSGSLTFLSILLGVFTLSLVNAIELKGSVTVKPWILLTIVTGFAIVGNSLISAISFFHHSKNISPLVENTIVFLFYSILVVCGLGLPISGIWIFYSS